jgi:hypothetical protein
MTYIHMIAYYKRFGLGIQGQREHPKEGPRRHSATYRATLSHGKLMAVPCGEAEFWLRSHNLHP